MSTPQLAPFRSSPENLCGEKGCPQSPFAALPTDSDENQVGQVPDLPSDSHRFVGRPFLAVSADFFENVDVVFLNWRPAPDA